MRFVSCGIHMWWSPWSWKYYRLLPIHDRQPLHSKWAPKLPQLRGQCVEYILGWISLEWRVPEEFFVVHPLRDMETSLNSSEPYWPTYPLTIQSVFKLDLRMSVFFFHNFLRAVFQVWYSDRNCTRKNMVYEVVLFWVKEWSQFHIFTCILHSSCIEFWVLDGPWWQLLHYYSSEATTHQTDVGAGCFMSVSRK